MSDHTIHVIKDETEKCAIYIKNFYDKSIYDKDKMSSLFEHLVGDTKIGIQKINDRTNSVKLKTNELLSAYSSFLAFAAEYYGDMDEQLAEEVRNA